MSEVTYQSISNNDFIKKDVTTAFRFLTSSKDESNHYVSVALIYSHVFEVITI